MEYKVHYLSSVEGIGKKSNKPYWMMTILITLFENGKSVECFTTNLFLREEQYNFVHELAPMQELDFLCVPSASKGIQIIQLDIVG